MSLELEKMEIKETFRSSFVTGRIAMRKILDALGWTFDNSIMEMDVHVTIRYIKPCGKQPAPPNMKNLSSV